MRRTVAVVWHASFSIIAGGLYFFFVLPRWWELAGYIPQTAGTALRIVAAVVTGLAALPVVFTLLRIRKLENGTPRLALTLLVASIVGHVLAGVLIAGTAVSEIWFSLNRFGPWLFGIYGAAAAIALLGIGAFYLSFIAALPPKPPKSKKRRRLFRKKVEEPESAVDEDETAEEATDEGIEETAEAAASQTTEADAADETEAVETKAEETEAEETEDATKPGKPAAAKPDKAEEEEDEELVSAAPRHRMPTGKRRTKYKG